MSSRVGLGLPQTSGPRCAPAAVRASTPRCAMMRGAADAAPTALAQLHCRLCDSVRMRSVLDLGATPPCGSFLTPGELDLAEPTFPLHLRVCENCLLLQISALVWSGGADGGQPYFSSFSDSWAEHAKMFVRDTVKRLRLSAESFVVEVASNDGYLLRHVTAAGIPCLGIEPSVNAGLIARDRGVPTATAFLDETLAREVRGEYGPADLVVANNVYSRIPDLRGFTRSLRALLADDGWLSIEVSHALRLLQNAQFDTIDHDHAQYYTLLSATRALATAGLAVVDAELLPTHGGSLRIWARPARIAAPPTDRVVEVLRMEKAAGLQRVEGYMQLRPRTEALRQNLLRFLLQCRANGERVVGYGALGAGTHLAQLLRNSQRPNGVHRGPRSVPAWLLHARYANPDSRSKADPQRPARCGLGPVVGSRIRAG